MYTHLSTIVHFYLHAEIFMMRKKKSGNIERVKNINQPHHRSLSVSAKQWVFVFKYTFFSFILFHAFLKFLFFFVSQKTEHGEHYGGRFESDQIHLTISRRINLLLFPVLLFFPFFYFVRMKINVHLLRTVVQSHKSSLRF